VRHVDEQAALGLEARADAELVPKTFDRPRENFLRLLVVEFDGDLAGFELVHHMDQFGAFGLLMSRHAVLAEAVLWNV
jgi:hypothetical protein